VRLELPRDAVEHVARQVSVAATDLALYDFSSRQAQRHRTAIRERTGWHECTCTDLVKLTLWLVDAMSGIDDFALDMVEVPRPPPAGLLRVGREIRCAEVLLGWRDHSLALRVRPTRTHSGRGQDTRTGTD